MFLQWCGDRRLGRMRDGGAPGLEVFGDGLIDHSVPALDTGTVITAIHRNQVRPHIVGELHSAQVRRLRVTEALNDKRRRRQAPIAQLEQRRNRSRTGTKSSGAVAVPHELEKIFGDERREEPLGNAIRARRHTVLVAHHH